MGVKAALDADAYLEDVESERRAAAAPEAEADD
jgi:hypothetical protein